MRRADLTSEELTELFMHGFKPVDSKKRKALQQLNFASVGEIPNAIMLRSFEEMLASGDKLWMRVADSTLTLLVQCSIDKLNTMYEEDCFFGGWTWRMYLINDGKISLKIGSTLHALMLNPAESISSRVQSLRKLLESMRSSEER